MSMQVFQLIVAHYIIPIADHLEDQEVLAMGKHEGARLSSGGIKLCVQFKGVLVNDLVLDLPSRGVFQIVASNIFFDNLRFDADEVIDHIRGLDIQSIEACVIQDMRLFADVVDLKDRFD